MKIRYLIDEVAYDDNGLIISMKHVGEVIRCKECKWCAEHYDTDGNCPYWICSMWDGGTDADGFCYEAKRKEE